MDFPSSLTNLFWFILSLVTLIAVSSSLAGFLGRLWWRFDLPSHFRVQYFILLTVGSIIFFLGGRYIEAIASGVIALINAFQVLPFYFSHRPSFQDTVIVTTKADPAEPHPTYRVLLANVLQKNQQYHKVIHLIQTARPDIIVLIEVNQHWIEELQPILTEYTHFHYSLREDNYGIALFSRIPFTRAETLCFGEPDVPSVVALFNLHGSSLTVVGTHPPPPKSQTGAYYRNQQLGAIAKYALSQPGDLMVLGDLNITPWSPYFRDLLKTGKLRDSQQGSGIQPSWPVDNPFLRVPIDHALVSSEIMVEKRTLGPKIGSDHLPVLVDFSLK